MLNKLLKMLKKSKGFLTKRGELVNWKEVHAIGLGIMDGIGFKSQGYRLEFWLEKHPDVNEDTMHYYEKGYFWAQVFKYVATVLVVLYFGGTTALKAFLL